jgi:general secretion pathway protein A
VYVRYFGFTERPFSLAPDPRFLYLSEGHREALAHLLYGIGEAGGFVQLTGEVGTGKTTVCRSLVDRLPPEVDLALVLNPRLTAAELMATVCDELRVPYAPGTTSLKVLVDALYQHLLDAHGRGRRTVVVIDEAQDLGIDALEQVRLLTNLETTREKLLQIILIGQPELGQLLDRPDLRQVKQRITARYHLLPFSERDTRAYVYHRLAVAGQSGNLFDERAIGLVHRASAGVPRLINILCDRALLGAYATGAERVDRRVVRRATREVFARRRRRRRRAWRWAAAGVGVAAILAGIVVLRDRLPGSRVRLGPGEGPMAAVAGLAASLADRAGLSARGAVASNGAAVAATVTAAPVAPAVARDGGPRASRPLAEVLADPGIPRDKSTAFGRLYAQWKLDYSGQDDGLACARGEAAGLRCLFRVGTWNVLRRFNLPAVVELLMPSGEKHYAAVTAIGEQMATLEFGKHRLTFPLSEIDYFWDGPFVVLWQPPPVVTVPLAPGMRGRDIAWLRGRLGELDGTAGPARGGDVYDEALKTRVMAFQRSQALVPDGIVGEETLTRLAAHGRDVPQLTPKQP